jgi:glutathione S-transferase
LIAYAICSSVNRLFLMACPFLFKVNHAEIPTLDRYGFLGQGQEATVIIEYLDHFFTGKHLMLPSSFDEALQVRLWDRVFDNYVQGPMQEIVNDHLRKANGDMTAPRSLLDTSYDMIDRQMNGRTWVASEDFSMADCAAAPALFYACTLLPFPDKCIHLKAYFERLMNRPSVQRVLEEAKPYFSFYPFSSAIAKRFL